MRVTAIVPVLNEEGSIGGVVSGLLSHAADEVIVADNGSTDGSAEAAKSAGATVVSEPKRGYGAACLAGIAAVRCGGIVVFADGDGCDDPKDLAALVGPIRDGKADLVIGSRLSGRLDPGALPMHSRAGNRIASILLRAIYGQRVSDLGPFRAIRYDALMRLEMRDIGFGWTAEMQAKAALAGLRVCEVPIHYRRRAAGKSKITGNVKSSFQAGWIIIKTLLLTRIRSRHLKGAEHIRDEEERICAAKR